MPEGLGELPDAARGAGLPEAAPSVAVCTTALLRRPPLQLPVQLPSRRVLQNEVHPLLVVEIAEQPQHVAVPEVRLDLDLAPQLVLDARRPQLALEEDLERDDKAARALAGEVDGAELALAQGPADVKVGEGPGGGCFRGGARRRSGGGRVVGSLLPAKEQVRRRRKRLRRRSEDSVVVCCRCCCCRCG